MKILIVDDHALFRSGMVHLLQSLSPSPTVVESEDLCSARRLLANHDDIDLVLLDLKLDDAVGVDSLLTLRKQAPEATIVVLSGEQDPAVIRRCIDNGAMGFITKSATHDELLGAIRLIVAGGVYLPRNVMNGSVHARQAGEGSDVALLASLSERQREVLAYLLQGKPNKTISTNMDISQNTVKAHLSAIFRTLGARNRTEAVYFAARAGVPLE
ncbi:MAG: response regulator transcription factor [Granulosicoccus sp.]|nr:response regulator transcription factor [Granulosicoccus sp.]